MVAASGAEVLLPARRAAASAAKPPVQDFHDESVTTAPRTTYSETAGATQISEALPEAVATTTRRLARTERLQSVPCNATARITAAPIVLRADDVASAGTSAACCTTQVPRLADRCARLVELRRDPALDRLL